ncbi:MAG: acyl-CoA synthetase FdrA [Casimicrobiaceae bacterium]
MPTVAALKPNLYKDSVALMRVSQVVLSRTGVEHATLLMGTPANKAMLREAGLWCVALEPARPNDLMIVVEAADPEVLDAAHEEIDRALGGGRSQDGDGGAHAPAGPRSLVQVTGDARRYALAQISVPGAYAGAEALKALKQGLHVFLFSDNVPVAQERALKTLARDRNLLVMGPDCGTAIIRGVPLGFANAVRRGAIGLLGASGTGLQAVSCGIDAQGHGVSHVIGTGGRDTSDAIDGITMHQALDVLADDGDTRVIGIVSKPPSPKVAEAVLTHARRIGKPCVVLFLGDDTTTANTVGNIVAVSTLEDAARATVALAEGRTFTAAPPLRDRASPAATTVSSSGSVRGLYSGGTFCLEAQLVWGNAGLRVASNVPLDATQPATKLADCEGHAAIDFGADEYTVGRPHPMIDMSTRIDALGHAARDPGVAVVALDVVLGYGSHDDPGGALAPAIGAAIATAGAAGRSLDVLCFVCGTEADPQPLSIQQGKLRAAGAIVVDSSTAMAHQALAAVTGRPDAPRGAAPARPA